MRHRLSGLSTYGLKGKCAGDEHPPIYAPAGVWSPFYCMCIVYVFVCGICSGCTEPSFQFTGFCSFTGNRIHRVLDRWNRYWHHPDHRFRRPVCGSIVDGMSVDIFYPWGFQIYSVRCRPILSISGNATTDVNWCSFESLRTKILLQLSFRRLQTCSNHNKDVTKFASPIHDTDS